MMVLTASRPFSLPLPLQVPDVETASRLRDDAYAREGIEQPSKPLPRVLFWLRPEGGRSIVNAAELYAVADAYKIPYT